jgi:hypothetical protein
LRRACLIIGYVANLNRAVFADPEKTTIWMQL